MTTEEKKAGLLDWLRTGRSAASYAHSLGHSKNCVTQWLKDDPEYADQVRIARRDGCFMLADSVLDATDNATPESVALVDMQARTKMKLLAVWHPREYGNNQQIDITSGGKPLLSLDAAAAQIYALFNRRKALAQDSVDAEVV